MDQKQVKNDTSANASNGKADKLKIVLFEAKQTLRKYDWNAF